MQRPPEREMHCRGTTLAEMREQIAAMSDHDSMELDDTTSHLLKAAVSEMGLDPLTRETVLSDARTIANLDRSERIDAPHLMEAINYRPLVAHGAA